MNPADKFNALWEQGQHRLAVSGAMMDALEALPIDVAARTDFCADPEREDEALALANKCLRDADAKPRQKAAARVLRACIQARNTEGSITGEYDKWFRADIAVSLAMLSGLDSARKGGKKPKVPGKRAETEEAKDGVLPELIREAWRAVGVEERAEKVMAWMNGRMRDLGEDSPVQWDGKGCYVYVRDDERKKAKEERRKPIPKPLTPEQMERQVYRYRPKP